MIKLSSSDLIATGSQRSCYRHPDEQTRCIKICHDNSHSEQMQKKEIEYLEVISKLSFPHFYRYFGPVETSKGRGYCYELIQDYNGNISPSLTSYKQLQGIDGPLLQSALLELEDQLRNHRILVHDLNGDNILVQKTLSGQLRLVLVDGIGDPSPFNFLKNMNLIYSMTFKRRWRRFLRRLYNNSCIH